MINNVTLVGRLTAKPELRFTQNNKAVASFTLAVNRPFKNQNGEREADFINCVIWGTSAENIANWNDKGSLIGITGRIQTRNYENDEGRRVYVTEVLVNNWSKLESRKQEENNQGGNDSYGNQGNQQPSNQGGYGQPAFSGGHDPYDISDDDLPF